MDDNQRRILGASQCFNRKTSFATSVELTNRSTAALPEEMKRHTNVNLAKQKRNHVVCAARWNCETKERFLGSSEHKTASIIHTRKRRQIHDWSGSNVSSVTSLSHDTARIYDLII